MVEHERLLTRTMLLYFMDKRGFELEFEDNTSEFTFGLGNEEFSTKEMTAKEMLEVLDQIVRW